MKEVKKGNVLGNCVMCNCEEYNQYEQAYYEHLSILYIILYQQPLKLALHNYIYIIIYMCEEQEGQSLLTFKAIYIIYNIISTTT